MPTRNLETPRQEPVSQTDSGNIVPIADDIVILVMGLTGSGKSSFINAIPGKSPMTVGYEMESCTTSIVTVEVDISKFSDFLWLRNRRLILVDTPGFDDTYTNGLVILKKIGKWVEDSYRRKVVLGGVIYLHDLSADRFSGTSRKSFDVFNRICGRDVLGNVAIATTKSRRLSIDETRKREARFKDHYWKSMIDHGAQVFRVDEGDSAQASTIVNAILKRLWIDDTPVLHIQRELVDEGKTIRQTLAWPAARELFTTTFKKVRRVGRRMGLA